MTQAKCIAWIIYICFKPLLKLLNNWMHHCIIKAFIALRKNSYWPNF